MSIFDGFGRMVGKLKFLVLLFLMCSFWCRKATDFRGIFGCVFWTFCGAICDTVFWCKNKVHFANAFFKYQKTRRVRNGSTWGKSKMPKTFYIPIERMNIILTFFFITIQNIRFFITYTCIYDTSRNSVWSYFYLTSI